MSIHIIEKDVNVFLLITVVYKNSIEKDKKLDNLLVTYWKVKLKAFHLKFCLIIKIFSDLRFNPFLNSILSNLIYGLIVLLLYFLYFFVIITLIYYGLVVIFYNKYLIFAYHVNYIAWHILIKPDK